MRGEETGEVRPRKVGEWVLEKRIGSGSFSVVWRGVNCRTGMVAAVKEVSMDRLDEKLRSSLTSEFAILRSIRHKNIVQMYDIIKEDAHVYLVLEYCAGGDLFERIKRIVRAPESFARTCLRHLASGLKELRRNNLMHRDLKPQNLLLTDDSPEAVLKIADFGFARNLQPQGLAETLCGSPLYMAPEILKFQRYDAKADLWSVGAILYELVVGRTPFTGSNHMQLLQNIETKDVKMPEFVRNQLSCECRSLIHRLLKRNPEERMTFEEFFMDPCICDEQKTMGQANTVWDPLLNGKGAGGMRLSTVGEDDVSQRRMSNGEGSSVATVVVLGSDAQMDDIGGDDQTHELQESVSNVLSCTSSDAFDKDYVMVEVPNSLPDSHTTESNMSLSENPVLVSKQSFCLASSKQRSEFLFHICTLLSELVVEKREGGFLTDALAALMLGVQLLDTVMELSKDSPSSCVGVDKLRTEMVVAIQQSDQLSGNLSPSSSSASAGTLPDVYDMIYQRALSHSRDAAVDELMGNYTKSLDLYQRALDLLWFLSVEARKLDLEPPMSLSDREAIRLQQYMMTIDARRLACTSLITARAGD